MKVFCYLNLNSYVKAGVYYSSSVSPIYNYQIFHLQPPFMVSWNKLKHIQLNWVLNFQIWTSNIIHKTKEHTPEQELWEAPLYLEIRVIFHSQNSKSTGLKQWKSQPNFREKYPTPGYFYLRLLLNQNRYYSIYTQNRHISIFNQTEKKKITCKNRAKFFKLGHNF